EVGRLPRVGSCGGRRVELGLGQDLVTSLVEDREKLVVNYLMLECGRRPEPEIIGVHEAEQIAHHGILDLPEFRASRADVWLIQQAQQRRTRREESQGFVLVGRVRQRLAFDLGTEVLHETPGLSYDLGWDFTTLLTLRSDPLDQVIEGLPIAGEPLPLEH